jgi:hypothetical protein
LDVPSFVLGRSQAIFRASVVPDGLPVIDRRWIEGFVLPKDGPGRLILNCYLGRGAVEVPLGATAALNFENGEETYPVFGIPSIGPSNAGLFGAKVEKHLALREDEVAFVVNVSVAHAAEFSDWQVAVENRMNASEAAGIAAMLRETQVVLDTVVGTYALFQYPLVWERMHERNTYAFVDTDVGATTREFQAMEPDNFIPFRLDAVSKVLERGFVDPVHPLVPSIVSAGLLEPFVFLQDSLWHEDIRARFLMQFWIVESLAERRASNAPIDNEASAFVKALENAVATSCPEYLARFKARKGDLVRRPLAAKVQACCLELRIEYDDKLFRRARRIRDVLSHGSGYEEAELREVERYIRVLSRVMLRRELEARGVFLVGQAVEISELPILKPQFFSPDSEQAQHVPFGLPSTELPKDAPR